MSEWKEQEKKTREKLRDDFIELGFNAKIVKSSDSYWGAGRERF